MLHAGHESIGGVHCSDAVDTGLDSGTADQETVSGLVAALGRGIEDRKSTRLNSSHANESRMPSSA